MVETKKVNLSAEKTEAEWLKAIDRFFLHATPVLFKWLEWMIIIGAIQVIANKTQDVSVYLILFICYWFLLFYFISFFYSIEFYGIPWIKSEKRRRTLSIVLSGLLSSGVYNLLIHLASLLKT
jgi:hypothetical protein